MSTTSNWWYKNRLEESARPQVLAEAEEASDLHVVVIGRDDGEQTFAGIVRELCKKKKIRYNFIDVDSAWVSSHDIEIGSVTLKLGDEEDTSVDMSIGNSLIFPRAAAVDNLTSQAMLGLLQDIGFFLVNDLQSMLLCDNKMASALMLQRNGLSTPRTAILSNVGSIEDAHASVGGKFPVIIKTLTGAQGIGVSKVNDLSSLTSVAQSLWKFNASLLIQEFLEIDSDVRSMVVGGKLIGAAQRLRSEKDSKEFRNNTHLGADTKPYAMTEEEIDLVEAAARASGALYAGVDHAMYKGKPYLLEVNGSPGIKSHYQLYNRDSGKTLPLKTAGKVTADEMILSVLEYFAEDKHRRPLMGQEAGWIETVIIDGLSDPIRAKLDTGNGAKASMLHVESFEIKGKKVKWKKNGKTFESDIVDESRAHRGGELFEVRPVIEEMVRFNNKKYKALIGLSIKDTASEMLVNRELLTKFKVSVNPNKTFMLSNHTSRNDKTDD